MLGKNLCVECGCEMTEDALAEGKCPLCGGVVDPTTKDEFQKGFVEPPDARDDDWKCKGDPPTFCTDGLTQQQIKNCCTDCVYLSGYGVGYATNCIQNT
jgi:hypothetical protein